LDSKYFLRNREGAIGFNVRSIQVACAGNPDCMQQAREMTQIFTHIGWQTTFLGPGVYAAFGAVGIRILGKSDSHLAHDLNRILTTVLGVSVQSMLSLSPANKTELQLIIGPKPPHDW
jgi:hypothetical protein